MSDESPDIDDLKHLGAAAAAAGPVTMIHYIGFSPGSASTQDAAGGERVERLEIGRGLNPT